MRSQAKTDRHRGFEPGGWGSDTPTTLLPWTRSVVGEICALCRHGPQQNHYLMFVLCVYVTVGPRLTPATSQWWIHLTFWQVKVFRVT